MKKLLLTDLLSIFHSLSLRSIRNRNSFCHSDQENLQKAVGTQNQNPGTDKGKATSCRLDLSGNSIGLTYNF